MVTIKKLSHSEVHQFQALIQVFEKVFEMENFSMPAREYLEKVIQNPGFMVFVAEWEGKIIGGLTGHTLDKYYSEKQQGYVYDLAVSVAHQRKGVGRKLMNAVLDYCKAAGYDEVFVQAETIDKYALDFYRSTPVTSEEDVRHFTYDL
ncbi:GNAT family N-acetyltransferase [Cyclobacterium plantarum]|uniref:GNAT family N-acetyltransferase n=1 Tax=Cyclobacterium plantarum TaxID=2716263 RepID=A0ABX0HHV5_9BACT|nr:GNAT family N-acetyltransferase [Cyclobacterium plantarum]NHE59898.1 GNAT family N-acetyltransferase [Cyclobacterium plantarum]